MNIFLGFEYSTKQGWEDIMGPPKKPSNWKDETYEKKLPELRAKQAAGAAEHLMAGRVSHACILKWEGGSTLDVNEVSGDGLVAWLLENVGAVKTAPTTIFGFELLRSLRLCGWQVAAGHKPEDDSVRVPYWIWNAGVDSNVTLVNLYSASGAKSDGLSLADTISHWIPDLEANAQHFIPKPESIAAQHAAAACAMANRMGLV